MSTNSDMPVNRVIGVALAWGVALWLIGYALGIILYFVLPTAVIGWVIMPIGLVMTLWVLLNKIDLATVGQYAVLSVAWTAMAIVLDYVFIVRLLAPEDGYYKLDVYLYYLFTFLMPLTVGWWRSSRSEAASAIG